jgi:hypothetical protein
VTPGLQRTDYSFEETVTGVRVETWVYPPAGPDTVRLTNAKFKFVVIDSANSPLRIQYYADSGGYTTPNYYIGALLGELSVKRFLATASPVDTSRYLGSDGRHVYLARSIGVLEWGVSHSTNSQRIILATLQSFQLK